MWGITRDRQWRYDDTHHGSTIALDYQGRGRLGDRNARGGHETRRGINNDTAKHTEASIVGWTVILCTTDTTRDGQCRGWVEATMERTNTSQDVESIAAYCRHHLRPWITRSRFHQLARTIAARNSRNSKQQMR